MAGIQVHIPIPPTFEKQWVSCFSVREHIIRSLFVKRWLGASVKHLYGRRMRRPYAGVTKMHA